MRHTDLTMYDVLDRLIQAGDEGIDPGKDKRIKSRVFGLRKIGWKIETVMPKEKGEAHRYVIAKDVYKAERKKGANWIAISFFIILAVVVLYFIFV